MINWNLFSIAISEYAKKGYQYIEVPWLVDEQAIKATIPTHAKAYYINNNSYENYLIGSAEQSFVYLLLKNKISYGKYMALTPCFRDEQEDYFHKKYFMKLELIEITHSINVSQHYNTILHDAKDVLSQLTNQSIVIQVTNEGSDLMMNNVEIGSYGVRSFRDIKWAYGTGLAEPRFSQARHTSCHA